MDAEANDRIWKMYVFHWIRPLHPCNISEVQYSNTVTFLHDILDIQILAIILCLHTHIFMSLTLNYELTPTGLLFT
jgi:hypothetical protein